MKISFQLFRLLTSFLHNGRRLCALIVCAVIWHTGFAANLGSLRFEHIAPEQGFPYQSISAIAQDQLGLMWIGTQAGLIKFDGYRATVYRSDPLDPRSISDNFVSALYVHHDGSLWIGTQSGLSLYDPRKNNFTNFIRRGKDTGPTGNYKIHAIVHDGGEGLWLATDYGLMHFDIRQKTFQDYRHDKDDNNSLRDDLITDLVRDTNNHLWIGTPTGLDHFDPASTQFEHINTQLNNRPPLRQNNIISLSIDKQQILWIGSDAVSWSNNNGHQNRWIIHLLRKEYKNETQNI